MENVIGIPLFWGVVGLALYSATFSIFGGLKVVVWTDVIQVVVLIIGGSIASYIIVNVVSGGEGYFKGLSILYDHLPEKFDMIFTPESTYIDVTTGDTKSAYADLPGISVLIGGMWIANLYYWGINQYIIQRALAAKSIRESQKGVAFAAFLKLLIPLIVVIPGIAAYHLGADISKADEAFPWVISNHIPIGLKGIVLAALVAAVGSSLSSMLNSTSTIYTLDIHKPLFNKNISEVSSVRVGQITSAVALIIGIFMTPALKSFGQIFQFIQEYTGFISPGILAIFMVGLFWKKATTQSAIVALVVSIPLSIGLKIAFPEIPFMNRMGICFLLIVGLMAIISIFGKGETPKQLAWDKEMFKTDQAFNFMAILICAILAAIYALFW
jgi:SSS family solute:Na+ symporter